MGAGPCGAGLGQGKPHCRALFLTLNEQIVLPSYSRSPCLGDAGRLPLSLESGSVLPGSVLAWLPGQLLLAPGSAAALPCTALKDGMGLEAGVWGGEDAKEAISFSVPDKQMEATLSYYRS